jgi:hypothetical protein
VFLKLKDIVSTQPRDQTNIATRMELQNKLSESSAAPVNPAAGVQTDGSSSNEDEESSYTKRDIIHYHYFGRRGVPIAARATYHSWARNLPFVKPIKTAWSLKLSEHMLLRLLYGYAPVEMPDKWFIYADGPNLAGKMVISFVRSWSGTRSAEILVQTLGDLHNDLGLWTGQVLELTYEGDSEGAEMVADAAAKQESSGLPKLEEETEVKISVGTKELKSNGVLVPKNTEKASPGKDDREGTDSSDVQQDESGEIWAKFVVVTSCRWVLGFDLGVDIPEPERWTKLAAQPAKYTTMTQTTYMGTSIPSETLELLDKLGPGTAITLN